MPSDIDGGGVTRRGLFHLGAAGVAAAQASNGTQYEYLTPLSKARILGRGNPPPSKLPAQTLRDVGLHPGTWFLEVAADPESNSAVERQLTRPLGTALDWTGLMSLADKHAVRYMHVCTCTNVADPFHMTVWEGVPLRHVIWVAKPKANVRRVYYYGYKTPQSEVFQSSLDLGRVLEDPRGELPVILAYKMNGQEIPAAMGGPVRMFVPGLYANKSVKWLQRIMLTNNYKANDTYAEMNNDTESALKTCARFVNAPKQAAPGQPVPLAGLAQVGANGLRTVQFAVHPRGTFAVKEDPLLPLAKWQDAVILPPPKDWGGGLQGGMLPPMPLQFDAATGKPREWPMRYALAHWEATLPGLAAGEYDLFCRTIDGNDVAQPMPRPLPRTGANGIHQAGLAVRG